MEAIMKNKYAKVFVVFLGAALLLSPLVMLISCKQLHKTPAPPPDLTNPPSENPGQGNPNPPNPNPSNPTPNTKYKVTVTQPANGTIQVVPALPADGMVDKGSELTFTLSANAGYKIKALTIGDATYSDVTDNTITQKVKIEKETAVSAVVEEEANPTPETGIFTDTQGNKVTIAPVEDYYGEIIGYRLTGDIYIEEINSEAFKAKLDTLNGKDLYTDSLNINCFTNQNSTLTPVTITPEMLNDILEVGINFSDFKLNNKLGDKIVEVELSSATNNYFDITKFAKFNFNSEFKLKEGSKILLKGNREINMVGGVEDHTEYPKVKELLRLINEPIFKNKITVGNVQLAGNLKELLPYLVPGPNKIKEEDGGIIFGNANIIPCEGELWTGFNGWISNTQKETVLKIDELKELCKRTKGHSIYVRNAVIENLNSKDSNQVQDIIFLDSKLANVNFKDSDLSKIEIRGAQVQGNLKFENTTLPKKMSDTVIDNLILKDITFPKEEILKEAFAKIPYIAPSILKNLEIHGNIKNSPLEGKESDELEELVPQKNMPENYTGSLEIYNKLKEYIYRGEAKTINGNTNPNYHGSIQKQQSQLLALLQTQNKSRG